MMTESEIRPEGLLEAENHVMPGQGREVSSSKIENTGGSKFSGTNSPLRDLAPSLLSVLKRMGLLGRGAGRLEQSRPPDSMAHHIRLGVLTRHACTFCVVCSTWVMVASRTTRDGRWIEARCPVCREKIDAPPIPRRPKRTVVQLEEER